MFLNGCSQGKSNGMDSSSPKRHQRMLIGEAGYRLAVVLHAIEQSACLGEESIVGRSLGVSECTNTSTVQRKKKADWLGEINPHRWRRVQSNSNKEGSEP